MVNIKNLNGFRRCYLCDQTFPATVEFYPKDKNRQLGIGYQCRPCARIETKKRSKPRPNQWANMTAEQKDNKKKWSRLYRNNGGWHAARIEAYKSMDRKKGYWNDIDAKWFKENIQNKPCIYCGRSNVRIGCDRINNSLGHIKTNVVPACGDCNRTRCDHFTHEEMIELGEAIKLIHAKRSTY
jgi:hypothetical protein